MAFMGAKLMLPLVHPAVTEETHLPRAQDFKHQFPEAAPLAIMNNSSSVLTSHIGICSDHARDPSCAVMFRGGVLECDSKLDDSIVETSHASTSAPSPRHTILVRQQASLRA
jgi:hypothetical protein